MKRFKQILYHTDAGEGSRSALERAAELALRNRGRPTVLGVKRLPPDLRLLEPALPPAELQGLAAQDLRERLEQFVEPGRKEGLQRNALSSRSRTRASKPPCAPNTGSGVEEANVNGPG